MRAPLLAPTALASAALALVIAGGARAADQSWAFTPPTDAFSPDALLDLRGLNERVAGETGYVTRSADGNSLVRGDGAPIRFWALKDDSDRHTPGGTPEELARHARFLAKRGVNLVRVFEDIASDQKLDDIDAAGRERLWRAVTAYKKEGIYVMFNPIWVGHSRTQPKLGFMDNGNGKWGALEYDHRLQDAYERWMKQTLTVPNPYTGIPLAQDPALAVVEIQNEDSLLFWTSQGIKGVAKKELRRQFCEFLTKKYGALTAAPAAWQGAKPPGKEAPDDFANGEAGLYIIWQLTQHPGGGDGARCADQMEFMATIQRAWYQRITDYLHKDLACKALVNGSNWRTADNVTMLDAERWSYCPGEVMAVNRYYTGIHDGPKAGWQICNGDRFTDASVMTNPHAFPIALKLVEGYPMMVTESSWVPPLSYQSEGPMLIAAYQSLNGVNGYFWFSEGDPGWASDATIGNAQGQGKWLCATPMVMGQWPAAALLFRKGYLKPGEPAVREQRALQDIWNRGMPIIAEDEGYDPNRDAGLIARTSSIKGGVDPLAYLVGPVRVTYGGDPAKSTVIDLAKYVDAKAKTVRSDTGEMTWDYGNGFCTMDAPKAQGATGFFAKVGGAAKLSAVDIACQNDYATVMVVAMDDQPLAGSGKILVQVGTRERTTGWQTKPATIKAGNREFQGEQVVALGAPPWLIENAQVHVVLRNAQVKTATALDPNGMPVKDLALERTAAGVSLAFPPDALYVVLH